MKSLRRGAFALASFLLLVSGLALAAQLTTSFEEVKSSPDRPPFKEVQLTRCDNSGSITSNVGAVGGETCSTGDHTPPVDCRGYTTVTGFAFEYGAGSADLKLWNCINPQGSTDNNPRNGNLSGIDPPGTEDPSGSPSAADPDPLCVDLTSGDTLDGTTTTSLTYTDQGLSYLVGEINSCTGNCDLTYTVICNK